MLKQTLLLAIMSCWMLAGSAQATILFEEDFDYTADTSLQASASWTLFSGNGLAQVITAPGLTYTGLLSTGNRVVAEGSGGSNDNVRTVVQGAEINDVFSETGTFYYTILNTGNADMSLLSSGSATNRTDINFYAGVPGANIYVRIRIYEGEIVVASATANSSALSAPKMLAMKIVNDASGTALDTISVVFNPDLSQNEATIFGSPDYTLDTLDISQAAASDGVFEVGSY